MKYMLMFWDEESAERLSEQQDPAFLAAIRSWIDEMRDQGIRLHGGPLSTAGEAAVVRVRRRELLVSDGPYMETKEQIGGYDVIECTDMDTAIKVAAAHPLAASAMVEVRPLEDFPGDE